MIVLLSRAGLALNRDSRLSRILRMVVNVARMEVGDDGSCGGVAGATC